MIGTGIFLFVSCVAENFQNITAILLIWGLGAAIAACGALCLAELAAAYPKTGGVYVFLHRAFGPLVAFLYVWSKFLIMRVGSFSIPALFFAELFAEVIGLSDEAGKAYRIPIALGLIALLTAVNIMGVRTGGGVQNLFTGAKIFCLLAIVGVGLSFGAGLLEAKPVTGMTGSPAKTNHWILLLGAALVPVLWTYGGWDESPFVAEEVSNPQRNLPLSILGGLLVVTVLFLLVNAAYMAVLSPSQLANSEGKTAIWAMQRALGPGAAKAVSVVLMISTFGAANGMALTGARIVYAAGQNQPFLHWFARTHPKTKTPVRALIIQAGLASIAIILLKDPMILLNYTGLAYWGFAGLMAAAVIVLRCREPDRRRPFRVWAYPLTPLLFILASMGMALAIIMQSWTNASATICIMAGGLIVFALQSRVVR